MLALHVHEIARGAARPKCRFSWILQSFGLKSTSRGSTKLCFVPVMRALVTGVAVAFSHTICAFKLSAIRDVRDDMSPLQVFGVHLLRWFFPSTHSSSIVLISKQRHPRDHAVGTQRPICSCRIADLSLCAVLSFSPFQPSFSRCISATKT